jgi:hypothetical protein
VSISNFNGLYFFVFDLSDIFCQRLVAFLFSTIFQILPSLPFFFVPTLNLVALSEGPFLNLSVFVI